jgi:hypothetical protein
MSRTFTLVKTNARMKATKKQNSGSRPVSTICRAKKSPNCSPESVPTHHLSSVPGTRSLGVSTRG